MGTPNKLSVQIDETGAMMIPVVIVDPTTPTQQAGVNASGQLTLVSANSNPNGQATMVNSAPVVPPSETTYTYSYNSLIYTLPPTSGLVLPAPKYVGFL